MRALGKVLVDLAPHEAPVEQHVRAVRLVHQRAAGPVRLLAVEHERQRLVLDRDRLGGVLGERPAVRHHRGDPFARIARDVDRERPARHVRRVEPGHQRQRRGGELLPVEHVVHARHLQRRALVDRHDARRRPRAAHQRDMARAGQRDVGREAALAGDEAAVLAHAAVGRDVAEAVRCAHGFMLGGRLAPRRRSAASATASTICA